MSRKRFKVTDHARKRAKERLDVSFHAEVNKEYKNALRYGHPVLDYEGDFKKFLLYKKNSSKNRKKNTGIKVFKEIVFIYSGRTMITAYKVPEKFKPTSRYLRKNYKESEQIGELNNKYGVDNVKMEVFPPSIKGEVYTVLLFIDDILVSIGTGSNELKAKNSAVKIHFNNEKTKEIGKSLHSDNQKKEVITNE